MTTRAQDIVIDRVASEYGGTKVKPLVIDGLEFAAVAVCGWEADWAGYTNPSTGESVSLDRRVGPWIIVADDGTETVLSDVES